MQFYFFVKAIDRLPHAFFKISNNKCRFQFEDVALYVFKNFTVCFVGPFCHENIKNRKNLDEFMLNGVFFEDSTFLSTFEKLSIVLIALSCFRLLSLEDFLRMFFSRLHVGLNIRIDKNTLTGRKYGADRWFYNFVYAYADLIHTASVKISSIMITAQIFVLIKQ